MTFTTRGRASPAALYSKDPLPAGAVVVLESRERGRIGGCLDPLPSSLYGPVRRFDMLISAGEPVADDQPGGSIEDVNGLLFTFTLLL